jgi:hypothetical protein
MERVRSTFERRRVPGRIFVHLSSSLLATALVTGVLATWPLIDGAHAPAAAQASVSVDFRTALQPYGRWEHVNRWGDVWLPANRPRGWRPYTVGHWAYTDDWGWYWASDQDEDAWGWVVYHYGHWYFDDNLGWVWVPGDEWSPGWVQWRRGADYVGWAPLPPDEQLEIAWRNQPDVWAFVRTRDFATPRISEVILPEREYAGFVRDTVVVNRTVNLRDQRIGVNPGIAPGIIAAAIGRPIRTYEARPRILAGTARIPGATEIRANELGRGRQNFGQTLRQTQNEIRPAQRISQPQPLGRNEQGRLGDTPPRAATAARAGGPAQPDRQGLVPGRENAQRPTPQPGTQGLAPRNQPQQQSARPEQQRPQVQQQRTLPSTQGLNPREQRNQAPQVARPQEQRPQAQRPQAQPQRPQVQQRELPQTQGLGGRAQPAPQAPARAPQVPQAQPQRQMPPRTEGLGGARGGPPGGGAQIRQPPQAAPQRPAPATEGRGGGGPGRRPQP